MHVEIGVAILFFDPAGYVLSYHRSTFFYLGVQPEISPTNFSICIVSVCGKDAVLFQLAVDLLLNPHLSSC